MNIPPMCECGHVAEGHDEDNQCQAIGCPCAKYRAISSKAAVNIPGAGPDAPTIINAKGAGQSAIMYRFDLLPPLALVGVAAIMHHGATKYGENTYQDISPADHLNHAMQHIFAYQAGGYTRRPDDRARQTRRVSDAVLA